MPKFNEFVASARRSNEEEVASSEVSNQLEIPSQSDDIVVESIEENGQEEDEGDHNFSTESDELMEVYVLTLHCFII